MYQKQYNIKEIVVKVISENPQSVADYKAGKDKAIGFIVGQVMKASKGKANPGIVNKLIIGETEYGVYGNSLYYLYCLCDI